MASGRYLALLATLAVFDWYLASSLTLVVLWLSHPCPSPATFGNGLRAKIHSSIGFPSMRCSCTKRGMRSAVMPRYHVPSGYTTMIGPPAQTAQALHLRPVARGGTGRQRQVLLLQFLLEFLPRLSWPTSDRAAGIADAQEDVPVELPDQQLLGDTREIANGFGHIPIPHLSESPGLILLAKG